MNLFVIGISGAGLIGSLFRGEAARKIGLFYKAVI
jgi:hypothetical protein